MATTRRNTKRKAVSLDRQQKALQLRRRGLSLIAIGAALGISKSQAHRLVIGALEDARAQIKDSADQLRAEELSRLDGMLEKVYAKAEKGDLSAVDRVIKIGERRARLLGLDAPVRTALQGGGDDAPPIATVSEAKVTFYMPDNGR